MIDAEVLKKGTTWMVIVPVVLGLWAGGVSWHMLAQRRRAQQQLRSSERVLKDAETILRIMRASGGAGGGAASRVAFEGLPSALACAQAALVAESRVIRGTGGKTIPQKDGSVLHRETYMLNGVRLEQAARFVDYAERRFSDLKCTALGLTHAPGKARDRWDAQVSLQYLVR